MIVKRTVRFIYPPPLLSQPLLYELISQFDLLTNILKAQVTPESGWLILAVRGEQELLEAGLAWMAEQGVQVEIITEIEEEL